MNAPLLFFVNKLKQWYIMTIFTYSNCQTQTTFDFSLSVTASADSSIRITTWRWSVLGTGSSHSQCEDCDGTLGDLSVSTTSKFVRVARSFTESAIFSVISTISISSEATVAAGIMDKRSVSFLELDWSNDLRLFTAAFAFATCVSEEDGLVIVLIDDPSSLKALLDSKLISEHNSWIVERNSWDPYKCWDK